MLKSTHKHNYCVNNAEHDFKNSVFKVISYVKYEFNFFLVLKFLTGRWSVGQWSVHVVGGRLVGWSVVLRKSEILIGSSQTIDCFDTKELKMTQNNKKQM